jgi:hypothetical protein
MFSEKTVLAIDPGSHKHGMALVRRDGDGKLHLLWRAVCPADDLESKLDEAKLVRPFAMIIVGSGTRSRPTVDRINQHSPAHGVLIVDETDTSQQARERYWEFNKRKGWRRFLPASMQVPPEPFDDYAAYILAERVLLDE